MNTILLSDARVAAVSLRDMGEPLVTLPEGFGPSRARVRESIAGRLKEAELLLPAGISLRVIEGHRSIAAQKAIIMDYCKQVQDAHPGVEGIELQELVSRFVSPVAVAPHVAGAAVDLTLVDADGDELDMGTPVDATPEQSDGACYTNSPQISAEAGANRLLMGSALGAVGLVNYPTEWWHWSYGDKYWAFTVQAPHALYGPHSGDLIATGAA